MFNLLNILVVTGFCIATTLADKSCTITLPNDLQGSAPILLTRPSRNSDYQLFKSSGQKTTLKENSYLQLACSGNKNYILPLGEGVTTLELKCSGGNFVDLNKNSYVLKELVCKSIPSSSLKLTNEECSLNRGYIFEAGFMVDQEFYGPTFKICYDNVTESTYYTHNTINGAAIKYNIQESTRRAFSAEGMRLTTTKTNNYYTQKNQESLFKTLFGSSQSYIKGPNYLARGHLTPDADFIFGYEQLSTYYYANVAPEYQLINAGNWLRVEELARSTAAAYGRDLNVYNGYLDILKLPRKNGNLIEIYLDEDKQLKAPKYYFKVLLDKTMDAGIVFVTVNNPFISDGKAEEICENVCEQSGLLHSNFPVLSKGYTFCCHLSEFRKYYDGLPLEVQAGKLLTKKN